MRGRRVRLVTVLADPLFTTLELQRVRFVTPWNTALGATPARAAASRARTTT